MISIFFVFAFSLNANASASASTESLCRDIAGKYASSNKEKRIITRGSSISFAKHINKSDVYCEVQCDDKTRWRTCTAFYDDFNRKYAVSYWGFTGNDYSFNNQLKSIIFEDKKRNETYRLHAKTNNELCEKIVQKAKAGIFSANSSSPYLKIFNPKGSYVIDKSLGGEDSTSGLGCIFEYAGTHDNKDKKSKRGAIFYGYMNVDAETKEIAERSCKAGQEFNEDKQVCEFPEPVASESCKKGVVISETLNPKSKVNLISYNGCEAKQSGDLKVLNSVDENKCLYIEFELTGNKSFEYMYKIKDSDRCETHERVKCEHGAVLNEEYNVCVKPELEDDEKSENPEDPDNYENTNPDDLAGGNLGEGEYVQCDEYPKIEGMQKETICNVYGENDEYKRPALVIEYPEGVYNPNICANGFTGSNCDKDPNAGGSIDVGNSNVLSGVNDIESLLRGNGEYLIDYDNVGEDPFSEDEEGEGESLIDIGESLTNHDKILSESGTCPAPKEIVLFENVVFAGKHIEKKFEFSYELFCDFSSKYKDIYIALFIMMLSIDFIRRVRK
ncbi:hypothetical protein BGL48_12595 [Salinivibrio sp. SS3]|uniref:hypothetical protein n=1 Tax=Salinivibrio sp. SS3 TaxID=1895021 RepID=UPI000847F95C|nr:hypothetical protein [Salinivibrio sp. BNH]ODP98406.1 hypothetical protein BGL48_12595 [Salinivibrio sp. BNH]